MAGDGMWLRKYRRNILHATGDGNISYINSEDDTSLYSLNINPEQSWRMLNTQSKSVSDIWQISYSVSNESAINDLFQHPGLIQCYSDDLSDSFTQLPQAELNGMLLNAVWNDDYINIEWALSNGANPNATFRLGDISACHLAALKNASSAALLLRHNAEKNRVDARGRTPLHFAAWAGDVESISLFVDIPKDQHKNQLEDLASDGTIEISNINETTTDDINVLTRYGSTVPQEWYDDETHTCPIDKLPPIQTGWTPLHAASSNVQVEAIRYLLSKGFDPNKCDTLGCTPLDVIASNWHASTDVDIDRFRELMVVLVQYAGTFSSSTKGRDLYISPLHRALKLESKDMLQILLEFGAPTDCIDDSDDTIFHTCVKAELHDCLQLLSDPKHIDSSIINEIINKKNNKGENVLHTALKIKWMPGILLGIEFGANMVAQDNDGNTAVHLAAGNGHIDILNKILSDKETTDALDLENKIGETAFCRAVANGHLSCVKCLYTAGATPSKAMPGRYTVVHIAAKNGYLDILEFLHTTLSGFKYILTSRASKIHEGFTPIHFAASYNHPECVQLLIKAGADVCAKSDNDPYDACTPLHEAVIKNNIEVIQILINASRETVKQIDQFGWTPLHSASFFGSREAISILLKNGSDFAITTNGPANFKTTAIDLIVNNLSKPTEFLEDIFDNFIASNDSNLEAPNCLITVDYRIISPDKSLGQSRAIKALISTGNRFGQRRLFVHPLIESFVYLKWKSLLPLFYIFFCVYSLFVLSVNIYIISVFCYQDIEANRTLCSHGVYGKYVVYATASILILVDLLSFQFKLSYICQFEVPFSFMTIALAISIPSFIEDPPKDSEWPRHLATLALLLSWLKMLLIISKFPQWGYYIQMLGKVSSIVLKVLLPFSFVVIGFSLSFMLQFHSTGSFNSPWDAFIKTIVMMKSEYDYEDTFKAHANMLVNKILFIIFVVIGSIVLMNLLIGLAVNDIQFLETQGHIRRIEKQVEFLALVDSFTENSIVKYFLPDDNVYIKRHNLAGLMLKPDNPNWGSYKTLTPKLRNAIFNKIQSKGIKETVVDGKAFKSKLDEIYKIVDKAFNMVDKVDRVNADINNIAAEIKTLKDLLKKSGQNID